MPVYGYRCQSCKDEFEVTQRMSDAPLAECPVCGGPGTRQFYPIGIHFRGSGFYKTDSRPASAASATSAAGDGEKTPAITTTKEPGGKPTTDSPRASPPAPTPTTAPKSPPSTTASPPD